MNRLEIEQRSEDCVDISDDLSTVKIRNAAQTCQFGRAAPGDSLIPSQLDQRRMGLRSTVYSGLLRLSRRSTSGASEASWQVSGFRVRLRQTEGCRCDGWLQWDTFLLWPDRVRQDV